MFDCLQTKVTAENISTALLPSKKGEGMSCRAQQWVKQPVHRDLQLGG